MTRRVLLLALALLHGSAEAQSPVQTEGVISLDRFDQCGFVSRFSPAKIEPQCFQNLQNAVLDQDYSILRRNGYSSYMTTPCATLQPVRGMWSFYGTDGSQYVIMNSSATMYYSQGNGACTAIAGLTGLSTTAQMSCVQGLGKLWCTNGIDAVFNTNVTSTASIASAPAGKYIGFFRNRVLIGGVSGTLTNLYLSGELDGTDWTIPTVSYSTSPAIISVSGTNDGQAISCLMGEYQNGYYVGRQYDTYILTGYDLRDFGLRKVDQQIGCMDNNSPQMVNNTLMWLSHRGVESLTGTQINWASYPIDPTVQTIIRAFGNTQGLTVNSNNFSQGNLTASGAGAPMSLTISPGNVVVTTFSATETEISKFSLGTMVNLSTSVPGALFLAQPSSATFINAGDESNSTSINWASNEFFSGSDGNLFGSHEWHPSQDTGDQNFLFYVLDESSNIIAGTSVQTSQSLPITDVTIDVSTLPYTRIKLYAYTNVISGGNNRAYSNPFIRPQSIKLRVKGSSGNTFTWDVWEPSSFISSASYTSAEYDTGVSTPVWGDYSATVSSSSPSTLTLGTKVASSSGGPYDSLVAATNGSPIKSAGKRYVQAVASFTVTSATDTVPILYDLTIGAATTGYYITPCIQVSTPTSWGLLSVNAVNYGGSFSFWVSTGGTCAAATANNVTWNSQNQNSIIGVTTNTAFVAVRTLFTLDVATETPSLNSISVGWNAGASRPPVASANYLNRYYMFYTTSTATGAANDHAVVYDQNGHWQLVDDVNAASATLYLNSLFLGDSQATGKVYLYDSGNDDAGGAFNFAFQTPDLDGGDPISPKNFKRAYILLGAPSPTTTSGSLNCSYTLGGSTVSYALGTVNLSEATEQGGYFVAKLPFPTSLPTTGQWVSLSCTNNGTVGPLRVYGVRIVYTKQDWP